MGFSCGIVGLPNVGKSTLFNCLSEAKAESANYAFCTIEPNVGVVNVPDPRLQALAAIVNPERILPANMQFIDIAGLVKGAAQGEGLGNKFLATIREVDAVCHVVRCFNDDNVLHVDNSVDPLRDVETIEFELIFADLETVEKRMDRCKKLAKGPNVLEKKILPVVEELYAHLTAGKPARSFEVPANDDDLNIMYRDLHLLTAKKTFFVANVAEDGFDPADNEHLKALLGLAESRGEEVVAVCASIESELTDLDDEERAEFLQSLGLESAGLDRLIQAGYRLLGLITYLTAGVKEVRAWTIRKGTKAPGAAGVIHTDFEKKFIKAETIWWEDFVEFNGDSGAREAGKMRMEGKEYIVKDGDVMNFKVGG
ncbi:MAG: redox-regulated ATPase YchF [Deltaproteobacteria bacterium]|nr:redox-regulated ATPase YchF [Deltaproteobacteria bacterium]